MNGLRPIQLESFSIALRELKAAFAPSLLYLKDSLRLMEQLFGCTSEEFISRISERFKLDGESVGGAIFQYVHIKIFDHNDEILVLFKPKPTLLAWVISLISMAVFILKGYYVGSFVAVFIVLGFSYHLSKQLMTEILTHTQGITPLRGGNQSSNG